MVILSNQIMLNIRRGMYKYIGDGSGRLVFDMKNGYVVKAAKNMAGREQNKAEYKISHSDNSNLFAEVVQASRDYNFIIMRKAKKINNIAYVWAYFNVRSKWEFFNLYEMQSIRNKYNLILNDLNKNTSWGIIDKRVVIIDYGFTDKVREQYY